MERNNARGSSHKPMPFKKIEKYAKNLQNHSVAAYKEGNLGLAKHFLIQACEIVVKDR